MKRSKDKNMKNGQKTIKDSSTEKKGQQWRSFEHVLERASKVKGFKEAYDEELRRLRIAKQIRELRTARKLTQKNMAERTGMPQSVIARLESGEHSISLDTLNRVAYALGKEVELV